MTDEEMKRLEEEAREAINAEGATYAKARASDVLALIERVRKAERKGAEEMRTKAAAIAREEPDWYVGGPIARRIDDLPLPGDAP